MNAAVSPVSSSVAGAIGAALSAGFGAQTFCGAFVAGGVTVAVAVFVGTPIPSPSDMRGQFMFRRAASVLLSGRAAAHSLKALDVLHLAQMAVAMRDRAKQGLA